MTRSLVLRPEFEAILREILSRHLPRRIAVRVFGSRAKATVKPYSDLDLALKGEQRLSSALLADLAEAFSESDLPFKVDILDWRAVAPSFQTAIDRDGVDLTPSVGRE